MPFIQRFLGCRRYLSTFVRRRRVVFLFHGPFERVFSSVQSAFVDRRRRCCRFGSVCPFCWFSIVDFCWFSVVDLVHFSVPKHRRTRTHSYSAAVRVYRLCLFCRSTSRIAGHSGAFCYSFDGCLFATKRNKWLWYDNKISDLFFLLRFGLELFMTTI